MSKGFIPIRRTLFEHFLYNERRVFSRFEAWLDLIQLASFMDGQTELIKGKAITRNRGEVIASVRWIASRWNWSIHKTCDFIEVLRSQEMVVVGKESGVTKISLVNFEKYNSLGKDELGNTKGNTKRNSKMHDSKGFDGNPGTAEGTTKGTNGEQSGNSGGTNIKKDNTSKKENEEGGAAAPRSPGEEKEEAMLKRQKAFYEQLVPFVETYGKEMVRAFYGYWTEPNKSRSKMKFEMEETWDLARRLITWETREQQFNRRGASPDARASASRVGPSDVEDLYQKFRRGESINNLVKEAHCDVVIRKGLTVLIDKHIEAAVQWRIKSLTGSNQADEIRMVEAYTAGTWLDDPDCKKDAANRTRIAKKIALMWLFDYLKETGKEAVFA